MKKFLALLPVIGLIIGIVAIATQISAHMSFLSDKTNNNSSVSTLLDSSYSGYLAGIQK